MGNLSFQSPVGWLTVAGDDEVVTRLSWGRQPAWGVTPLLNEAQAQVTAYFDHALRRFDLPLSFPATPFQHAVLESMFSIDFGTTRSYGEIAAYVGASPQAVGRACGANPVPIIIPCHRVVGASSLGGYSGRGGLETKVFLLRHEGAASLLT